MFGIYLENKNLDSSVYLYAYGIGNPLYRSTQAVSEDVCYVMVDVNPVGSGEILGVGNYLVGKTAILTAKPYSGYEFVNWTSADGDIYKSDDKGITWNRTLYSTGGSYIPCFEESSNGILFAGFISFFPQVLNSGILCSNDGGSSWTRSGLIGSRINAVAQNSKGTLFAATSSGSDDINLY